MSGEVFDRQILADKLSKLNSSQQSIESLSRWCISHRKKAKQIIETWDKLFNSAQREQRVSFLYLANDILQNSRRKGSEFVNEFWKVLPGALKHVYGNGDEHGKKAASRLVDIWVERKVFGSRGENLKNEMLGKGPPSLSVSNRKSSNPIKIMKKDAHSLKIRLVVGGMPQKIVTAFQSVDDENISEEAALNKCKAAVNRVVNMEKSIESISTQGNQQGSAFLDEIQEQENVLQQCVRQLESAEATRIVLVSQLKEALQDQVPKLEHICTQLQVARGQVEQVNSMRHKLTSPSLSGPLSTSTNPPMETTMIVEPNLPSIQPTSSALLPPLAQPVISFASSTTAEEENKKAAAAAVAAKLAASTSSAQMLTSVLSSLVAEEAAFGFASGLPMFSPKKRPKLETSSVSDVNNSEMSNTVYFNSLQQQPMTGVSLPQPTNMQSVSQDNQIKASFPPQPPPPPPLPPMPPPNSAANQFVQSAGLMVGVFPYGYGANSLLPLGPPSHNAMGARLVPQPLQQPQPPSQQLQPPTNGGFYQAPSNRIYGHSHQPVPPPLPRQ